MLGFSFSCQNRVGAIRSCGRCWREDVAVSEDGVADAAV